jgi:hypothetical protein
MVEVCSCARFNPEYILFSVVADAIEDPIRLILKGDCCCQ